MRVNLMKRATSVSTATTIASGLPRARHAFHVYCVTSVHEHGFESVKEQTIFWFEQELVSQHAKEGLTRVSQLVL